METSENVVAPNSHNTISRCLNALLADQYILMNKTTLLLMQESVHSIQKNLEASYAELKTSVSGVVEFARSNQAQVPLSINSFLHHTRLQAITPFKNVEVFIEQLVQDYETTIKNSKNDLLICKSDGLEAMTLFASINTLFHNNVLILQQCLKHLAF